MEHHRHNHHPQGHHHNHHPPLQAPPLYPPSHRPYVLHEPPLIYGGEGSFVNSPLPYHHPPAVYDDRPPLPRHPHDVVDDFSFVDRRRFDFREPRVSPLSPIVPRQVNPHDYLSHSPHPFLDHVDRFSRDFHSPRFTEEFVEDRRDFNVIGRDELHSVHVYDDMRSMDVIERDDLRRNVVYDDWRSMTDFEREELLLHRIDERRRREGLLRHRNMVARDELICDRINDERRFMNYGLYRDSYHPEVLFRDSEFLLRGNDFVRGEVFDTAWPIRDENVPVNLVRHGGFDARSNVLRSPNKFRGGEFASRERFPEFYEGHTNRGFYDDKGRIERGRVREDLKECDDHTRRKNLSRKKSAFLRLQPAIEGTSTSTNKLDKTTPSPHKGKEINVESLGPRSSEEKLQSAVDLDVSFKSNALVAKAIIDTSSSSGMDGNDNFGGGDLDTRIVSESPLKGRRSRNRGNNTPVPKKEEKQSDNKVRVSPILMKVGIRKVAEVPDNSSKSSSSGSSSLAGGDDTFCKTSLEGEVLSKNDKKDGFCKASSPSARKKRKTVNLTSCLSSSVPTNSETGVDVDNSFSSPFGVSMSDAIRSLEPGCVQDDLQVLNLDVGVTKFVEKRSSDIDAKKGSDQDQVGSDYVEGSSEPIVVSVVDSVGNIDNCCGHVVSHDSPDATNSILCDVDASIMTEYRAYLVSLVSSDVNVYEPRELSPKCNNIGEQFRDVHIDDDGDEAELGHSGVEMKSACSPSIDLSNADILSTDCMKMPTISDTEVTNGTQEQQCTGAGSILVDDGARKRRKLSLKDCVSMEGDLGHRTLSSVKEDTFSLDRKRKAGIEVCDIGSKDCPCNCSKKRKSIPFDSVCIDTSVSESCDLCAPTNASNSIASCPLDSVDNSEQAAGGLELSNFLLPPEDVVGEAINSLLSVISVFDDSSKAKVHHKDSHSSVEEIAQSSYMAESGWIKKDDHDLIGAGNCLGIELIGSDSEVELEKNYQKSGVHCIRPYHASDLNDRPVVNDMECENNIIVEGDSGTLSDCPLLCTEPTQEIVTRKPVMLDKPSNVNSLGIFSQDTSDFDISSRTIDTTLDIICGDDNQKPMKSMRALISQSNLVCGGFQKNVNPGFQKNVNPCNSATPSNRSFTQKAVSVPSNHAKKAVSVLGSKSRQFSWRNELTHGKATLSSSKAPPGTVLSKKSLATIPAKPRTWHRTDNLAASNTIVKKPSPSMAPPQWPPYGKSLKVQDASYIRKGNSLVRNQASSTTALGPHAFSASIIQEKPIVINRNEKLKSSGTANSSESPDSLITGERHTPIEIPKIPPLPCSENTSDCNIAYVRNCTSPLQVERFEGMDYKVALNASETALSLSENPEIVLDRSLEDAGNLSDGVSLASNVKRVVYIKCKANQLIAASRSPELSCRNMDKKLGLSSDNSYYKRRKNQLIRASSESNIQKMVSAADDSSYSRTQRAFSVYSGRSASKGLSSRVKSLKVPLVWKLGDAKSSVKGSEPLRSRQLLSHLLPWKRTTYRNSVWRASASSSCCSSLKKPRKLLTSKNQAVLYKRSGRGFSLRRSKVISLAGSLKWSKSMEKHANKVDEEAALAVAESDSTARQRTDALGVSSEAGFGKLSSHKSVNGLKLHPGERIFRVGLFRYRMDPSRRTLQRIPDEEAPNSSTSKTEKCARKFYVPKRLLIGSNEYVRIGNGNQLVRDPKRRTRILANEKVRWSLHTARSRLAKKRKFCQFFTRFGQCNKSEGKCPYIHDSSKISVCTKFLKGLCTDPNCKLTHKVIPDRMPDCSFFLQGLCSNESCPYRHVDVDPKASICESFLRGYCTVGNECRKKHSYLCPEYEATGSCPQGSKCKLYHPKKSASKKVKVSEDQRNIKGRYFDPEVTTTVIEPESETDILEKDVAPKNSGAISGGDLGDYISLDVSDDEEGESIYPNSELTCLPELVAAKNSSVLSGGVELSDYIYLEETGENKYPNSEVMYLSEFDVLSSLSDDADELAKPRCILDTQ